MMTTEMESVMQQQPAESPVIPVRVGVNLHREEVEEVETVVMAPAIFLITRFVPLLIVPLIAGLQDVYQQTGPGQHGLRKRQDQFLAGGIVTQGPPASRVAEIIVIM